MALDYGRLVRLLDRCDAMAADPNVDPSVKRAYEEKLRGPAHDFRSRHFALVDAEAKAKKEGREADAAFAMIARPYEKARAVFALNVQDVALPPALGSLTTDTDRVAAIAELQAKLDDYDDEPGWAQELTDPTNPESFGSLAPIVIREVGEAVLADSRVDAASDERAKAFGVAYKAFLGFKNVVRATYGKSSIQYRRIHVRRNGKLVVDDEPQSDAPGA